MRRSGGDGWACLLLVLLVLPCFPRSPALCLPASAITIDVQPEWILKLNAGLCLNPLFAERVLDECHFCD